MRFTKEPKIDRKTKVQVGWHYRFWIYNPQTKRNERVPVEQLPGGGANFTSDEQAQAYCDIKSAEEDALKVRIQRR